MTAHIGSSQVKHSREEGRGSGLLSRKSRVGGLARLQGLTDKGTMLSRADCC